MNWLLQNFVKLFHPKFLSSVAQSSFKFYFGLIKLKLIFVNSQYSPIVVLFTLDQYFFIDNIAGTIPFASLLLSYSKLNMPWRPHSYGYSLSVGLRVILGIKTFLVLCSPPAIEHSRRWILCTLLKISLVPLHNPIFGLRFLIKSL